MSLGRCGWQVWFIGLVSLSGCALDGLGRPDALVRTKEIRTVDLRQAILDRRAAEETAIAPREPEVDSDEPLALTLPEVRQIALEQNLELRVELLDPLIAETRVSEEEAKFDATIMASARYKRSDLPALDDELVEFTSSAKELDKQIAKLTRLEQTKRDVAMELGIKAPLPTGGEITVKQEWDEQVKLEPQRFEQYVTGLRFSLSQPLLRNAGVGVNTASIRIAAYQQGIAGARTKLSAIRILAAAEKAYWRTYAAQQALRVRTQQYELAEQGLTLVNRRVEEGLSPEIETVRAELGVAERQEALIVAETAVRIQQRRLAALLNRGVVTKPRSIIPRTDPLLTPLELNREQLIATALRERMELLELELELGADAVRVDFARNQTLPLFVLDFEYGLVDRNGSFGTAWDGMWDYDNNRLAVGIRGEIPVTNEARRARLRRAILARSQRLASVRQRELAVRQEVHETVDVLEQNWQRVLAARKSVAVAGTNYDAETRQFIAGTRTMREVLEALAILGDAQLREVGAIVDYQIAQIDVAFATGTLLGYARFGDMAPTKRIELPPAQTTP